MAAEIDPSIIHCLIEVGSTADLESGLTGPRERLLRAHARASMLHWRTWLAAAAVLSTTELTSLVRGMAAAIKWLKWNGGSTSPVIWLFSALEPRLPFQEAFDLADWISRNVPGYCLPFGSVHGSLAFDRLRDYGAPSLGPLGVRMAFAGFALQLDRDERRRSKADEQAAAKAARLERMSKLATEHQGRKANLDAERAAMLAAAELLDPVGRLRLLLERSERSLAYFPARWAEVTPRSLGQLTEDERGRLLLRVATARKQPWRTLREELGKLVRPA